MQRVRVTFIGGKRRLYRAEKVHVFDLFEFVLRPAFEPGTLILNASYVQSVEYLDEVNTNGFQEALSAISAAEAEMSEQSETQAPTQFAVFPNINPKGV